MLMNQEVPPLVFSIRMQDPNPAIKVDFHIKKGM